MWPKLITAAIVVAIIVAWVSRGATPRAWGDRKNGREEDRQ